MGQKFVIKPGMLTLADCFYLIQSQTECILDPECLTNIEASYVCVQNVLKGERSVYGINTGFGSLAQERISVAHLQQLQRNIVVSHACGTGDLLDDEIVALILLLKINSLAQGFSGVRLMLIEALLKLYNHGIFPCIPAKGSVGASGDLAPLAHCALPLLGEGDVRYKGKIISAVEGLKIAGLQPFELAAKEGLALLNGLQASAAIAIDALYKTEILFNTAILSGALSVDAALGSDVPFDARIQAARGHQSQAKVAQQYQSLLKDSPLKDSHKNCTKVQDPYSLRCQPQIMGAISQQIQFVKNTLAVEVNSVTDNPLIFAEDEVILSGGNFHGEMIAMAADNLALAIAEIGASSERRIALLIDKNFSGLPAFLVKESGLNSGFMIAHVTAAACASDNKALAHPHSVDSLPTSANQEDHVSMATNAARRLDAMLDNTATIIGIELLAACQGLDFHLPLRTSSLLTQIYDSVRELVPGYDKDRYFAPDIEKIKKKVMQGSICELIDFTAL